MSTAASVGVILGSVSLAGIGLAGAQALFQSVTAQTDADGAALAAADALTGWIHANPCEIAQTVAQTNGSELLSCTPNEYDMTVSVTTQRVTLFGDVQGRARAGWPTDQS